MLAQSLIFCNCCLIKMNKVCHGTIVPYVYVCTGAWTRWSRMASLWTMSSGNVDSRMMKEIWYWRLYALSAPTTSPPQTSARAKACLCWFRTFTQRYLTPIFPDYICDCPMEGEKRHACHLFSPHFFLFCFLFCKNTQQITGFRQITTIEILQFCCWHLIHESKLLRDWTKKIWLILRVNDAFKSTTKKKQWNWLPLAKSYLCESRFPAVTATKSKLWSRPDINCTHGCHCLLIPQKTFIE